MIALTLDDLLNHLLTIPVGPGASGAWLRSAPERHLEAVYYLCLSWGRPSLDRNAIGRVDPGKIGHELMLLSLFAALLSRGTGETARIARRDPTLPKWFRRFRLILMHEYARRKDWIAVEPEIVSIFWSEYRTRRLPGCPADKDEARAWAAAADPATVWS